MKLWIARRKSGNLYLFFSKPHLLENNKWFVLITGNHCYADSGIKIDANEYKEVTFENSPQEIELKLTSEKISESIVNEFMDTLNFTYDKSEKCMIAKIYNADLTSLKNIIESKLE